MPLSGHRSARKIISCMIQAIVALLLTAYFIHGLWQIIVGLCEITVGICMIVTGAILFCASCLVESVTWTARLVWR